MDVQSKQKQFSSSNVTRIGNIFSTQNAAAQLSSRRYAAVHVLRISIHIALATICAVLGSCQMPTSGQKQALHITRYVGTWGPVRVNNVQLDSVQARHRLILRIDTTYSCTFSLESFDLNDTTHFSSPFVGRWSPYLWEGEAYVSGVGVFFTEDSNRFVAKWRTIVGGADDRKMSFYDSELGGPMRDIEWVLIR